MTSSEKTKKVPRFWILASAGVMCLLAAPVFAVSINAAIPGMSTGTSTPPGGYVLGFYNFTLMIGGVLALGAIVYGGILYAASAGNPSKQSEGREWIKSALIGLLLLAGAYLVLYTINPDLVKLNLPSLTSINTALVTGSQGSTGSACTDGHSCGSDSCVNGQCQAVDSSKQGGAAGTGCQKDANCASGLVCQWVSGNRVCTKQSA